MSRVNKIKIDDVEYIRADSVSSNVADTVDGMRYCVVRTYSAGVHIGYVKSFADKHPQQAELVNSRRLYGWKGACSLSQVAMDGVDSSSKIAVELPTLILTDVIEIIPCSEKAKDFFIGAEAWKI